MDRLEIVREVLNGQRPPLTSAVAAQRPLLYFPGLPQRPMYDLTEFQWIESLLGAYDPICDELSRCLKARVGFESIFPDYADSGRWAGLWFYKYGRRFDANCAAFPETMKALDSVPRLAGWASLSALAPGAHVKAHCGVTNAKLRLHFALRADPGSQLRVDREKYEWGSGKIMVFDDSYEHEVWVTGTRPRIVLIADFYHPSLTDDEVALLEQFESEPSSFLRGRSLRELYNAPKPSVSGDQSVDWVYDGWAL